MNEVRPALRLCCQCIHRHDKLALRWWWQRLWASIGLDYPPIYRYICRRPYPPDPVTGEVKFHGDTCSYERHSRLESYCGPEGRFFE